MALFSADFGKRIRRVVQRADFGRAEKSEVLTDEIQSMEKLIDVIKQSFQATLKRFQACLPPPADPEKRLKRLPESIFSMTLNESAGQLSQSLVFSKTFGRFGEAEQSLADALLRFTIEVEKSVLQPLVNVVDKDIPAIQKLRKQLTNMALDMDSAKKNLVTLQKQGQIPPGKIDSAREDLEAEEVKVDQCRDQLLTEIYQFFSREEKLCKLLLSALQLQADYHRQALVSLEKQISQMNEEIDQNSAKPVYGLDLHEHLLYNKQEIATVIEVCVQSIEKLGLDAEGLFRIAPSTLKLRKLTAAFDANIVDDDLDEVDVHCLAGALKLYLRELPNPLMTFELYNDWANAAQREGSDRINALLVVIKKLPKANYTNLRYLIRFLSSITKSSDVNKMSATNLAIVMAPNLLYPSKAEQGSMQVTGVAMSVVEPLISQCDLFFPIDDAEMPLLPQKNQTVGENMAPVAIEMKGKSSPRPINKKPFGDRPKKSLAPAPPIDRQRSESVPCYNDVPNSNDTNTETADKPKNTNKLSPPPPKKTTKSAGAESSNGAENNISEEKMDDGDNTEEFTEENQAQLRTGHNKIVRCKALDDDHEENKPSDDEGGIHYDVFTPENLSPESNPKPHSPPVFPKTQSPPVLSRKNSYPTDQLLRPAQKPERSLPDMTAPGSSNPTGITIKSDGNHKQSAAETARATIMKHFRNKSYEAETMSLSTSSAPFTNKYRNLEMKSATLPTDAVSLCQMKSRMQDEGDPSSWSSSTEIEVAEVKQKARPKVPPRSPRDKNGPTPESSPRYTPLENTHL